MDKAVVVTTEHRGVFFGYLVGKPDKTVELKRARNCVYWSSDVRGFVGLATAGPSKSCRVGPAVPSITLFGVTAILECDPSAAKAWEAQPWG